MKYRVRVQDDAQNEIERIVYWYEEKEDNLGIFFLHELDEVYTTIQKNPRIGKSIENDIKRLVLHKFPYNLYYSILNSIILILACTHAHRNPEKIRALLNERWKIRSAKENGD